jgi:hypothetical protein
MADPVPYPTFDSPEGYSARQGKRLALSLVALTVFLAWQGVMLRRFITRDTRPPSWDQAIHLEIGLDYKEALSKGDFSAAWNLAPKPGMPPFPPLYHLALTQFVGGPDPAHSALWVNWIYLCILCVSLFGLIYQFRPDTLAVAGAVGFCSAPAIQELLTTQLIDLSVISWSAAAYWALVACDDFKKWRPSLAFGALYAVGMLHKWSFFSYMIPAYIVAIKALGDTRTAWRVCGAAALSLALFGPWYATHAAIMIPRLFEASSDFAIPVWKGGAFLTYLLTSIDGLGPVFWLFAWIGLLVPHYFDNEDKGWIVWTSVLLSYVFWTIVPNRQLRFLLPGLPGLAVAFCGAWPNPMIWTITGLQLFFALNFSLGWLPTFNIPLPMTSTRLFPTGLPRKEDWKIGEILREAEKHMEPGEKFANLTLVANHPYFNGPTMTWVRKQLGLTRVNVRGVNKRLCEFSQFVVLKDNNLGPESVIGGLPEAAKTISDSKGWFQGAYDKLAQFDLPDASKAILYGRRRMAFPPFKSKGTSFAFYESGQFTAQDFKADLGAWDAARGVYPLAKVSVAEGQVRGLRVVNAAIEFEDVLLVPAGDVSKSEWDEVRFLKLKTLRVKSASVLAADVRSFIESRVKGLTLEALDLDGTVKARGSFKGFPISAEASLEIKDNPKRLEIKIVDAQVGSTSAPADLLLGGRRQITVPFEPSYDLPFSIDVQSLSLKGGKLSVR